MYNPLATGTGASGVITPKRFIQITYSEWGDEQRECEICYQPLAGHPCIEVETYNRLPLHVDCARLLVSLLAPVVAEASLQHTVTADPDALPARAT
jgi:hypothetical protein